MGSDLKKLSNVFIVLAVFSGIGSIVCVALIHDLLAPGSPAWGTALIAGIIFCVPVIFASLAVILRKVEAEMASERNAILQQLTKLEKRLDKLE